MSGVRLTTRQLFTSTVVAAGLLTFARMMGLSDGATLVAFGPLVVVALLGRYLSDLGCLMAVFGYALLVFAFFGFVGLQ
ncbi:hypothetical protein [Lacipirellula limnantheis]|uniref:Uncharacterized protein n=1 Tax=Lacipirellula limnantheis TaxID=2528024 RepID=A0A517TZL9_9BACT|nr:hypothetical protein [Lacipirellula limnantheis]QDT73820.1 hypothetical protein I41_30110 [Lacipirellula limnantheis]